MRVCVCVCERVCVSVRDFVGPHNFKNYGCFGSRVFRVSIGVRLGITRVEVMLRV